MPATESVQFSQALTDWIEFALASKTWRDRSDARNAMRRNPALLDEAESINLPTVTFIIERLFTHPFDSFEPRRNNEMMGDEQEAFIDSTAFISMAVGGNGSGKTFCGAHKCAKFVSETKPPGPDTPFWIIGNSYELVCSACWRQKLSTILPSEWIQKDRITWQNAKKNYPLSVPLTPWPDGSNWVLEFKSYEQGRELMQASAIGGAWFTEQFPFEVFLEVIRGCREFAYPGAVFAEFTPIDPEKSVDVEIAYEGWLIGEPAYDNWAFYRLNTEAALRAGHVDKTWYDTFFSTVSEEMQDTRKKGTFASYENAVYQSFLPRVHLTTSDQMTIPRGCIHKRSIDWGASEEHPFVCYDQETEVLTQSGWKPFCELTQGATVGTVNTESRKLEFQEPTHYITKAYDGPMYVNDHNCASANFAVTPGHRMVVEEPRTGEWRLVEVENLKQQGRIPRRYKPADNPDPSPMFTIPRAYNSKGLPPVPLKAFAEFLGIFLSEGCVVTWIRKNRGYSVSVNSIKISQSATEPVKTILENTGWKWSRHKSEFSKTSKTLVEFLTLHGANNRSGKKRIPRFVFEWPIEIIEAFLWAYELGDGLSNYGTPGKQINSRTIFTSSEGMADDLQELCARIGQPTNVSSTWSVTEYGSRMMYSVRLVRTNGAKISKLQTKIRHYSGMVYCVTVPNGTLVVRRHGKTMVCGNCLWGAKDALGRWIIYDEYWTNSQTVLIDDHVREIKSRHQWPENDPYYRNTYGDPSRPDMFREFGNRGISITSANNQVHEGIESVRRAMKINPVTDEPGLIIFKDKCPKLARQMATYRWEKSSGRGVNPKAGRPIPLKLNDDSADSLRYLIHSDTHIIVKGSSTMKAEPPKRKSIRHTKRTNYRPLEKN